MKNQKNAYFMTVASILAISFLAMAIGTITPAVQNIAMAYPDLPYTTIMYVSTLPTLLLVPATLITGAIAGKKVSLKTLALIGTGLFVLSGIAPAFINSTFTLVLISRGIFGIALGIMAPLGNAIIFGSFEGQQRANLLGMAGVATNVGGVLFQMLGGTLAGINWSYCFLAHGLGILSFVIILFCLKDTPAASQTEDSNVEEKLTEKPKVPVGVWVIAILLGVVNILNFPTMMAMSTLVVDRGIGDATAAATILSLFTVGGMIGGALFGKVYQTTQRFIIAIGCILMTLGVGLLLAGNSFWLMSLGSTVLGLGFSFAMPCAMMIVGMIAHPSISAFCVSITIAVMNIAAFFSTYWIMAIEKVTGDGFIMPIKIELVVFAIAAVVFLLVDPFPKPKVESEQE